MACWLLSGVLLPDLQSALKRISALADVLLCIPAGANRLAGFVLYAVIGYFLIQLNNTFALIRMRASVQTSVYILLMIRLSLHSYTVCRRLGGRRIPRGIVLPAQELSAGTSHE